MPKPEHFRLTLTCTSNQDFASFEFDAFPTASCTLAQHFAAKAWYELQSRLEEPQSPQEAP